MEGPSLLSPLQLNCALIFLAFIRQALGQGTRLDGRNPNEYREIEVTLSRSEVSATATVVIGNTRVISVVSGEIIAPYPDRPTEGDRARLVLSFY